MIQIYRFSQRLFLLIFTATVCVLFVTRRSDYSYYGSNVVDSKIPVSETKRISYVNLRNLSYSMKSAPRCNFNAPPYLLILVHSSPSHFIYRSTIRQTWGSVPTIRGNSIRVVFLLGDIEGRIGSKLQREMEEHNDIVKGNFGDSYRNLTYKHILGYKWFLSNCERVSVVMKVDDDVFIDLFRTIHFLTNTFGDHPVNLLVGLVCRSTSVLRKGKWSVSKEEYPLDFYSDYLSGFAYFVTTDVARRMYSAIESVPFFWIDDVFMTGFVADAAQVMRTDLSVRFAASDGFLIRWLLGNSTQPSSWIASEVDHRRLPHYIHKLWTKTAKAWGISSIS